MNPWSLLPSYELRALGFGLLLAQLHSAALRVILGGNTSCLYAERGGHRQPRVVPAEPRCWAESARKWHRGARHHQGVTAETPVCQAGFNLPNAVLRAAGAAFSPSGVI